MTATITHREAVKTLSRPVLLPFAAKFSDLFATSHRWNFGEPHTFPPREIKNGEPPRGDFRRANEIGPFCNVRAGGARWHFDVVANDAVIAALEPRIVTPNDALSFEIIEHAASGYALVICQHGYIIGNHWLAYIDPATIPYRPEV